MFQKKCPFPILIPDLCIPYLPQLPSKISINGFKVSLIFFHHPAEPVVWQLAPLCRNLTLTWFVFCFLFELSVFNPRFAHKRISLDKWVRKRLLRHRMKISRVLKQSIGGLRQLKDRFCSLWLIK